VREAQPKELLRNFQETWRSGASFFPAARLTRSGFEPFFPPFAATFDFFLPFCCHQASYSHDNAELMPHARILGVYAHHLQQSAAIMQPRLEDRSYRFCPQRFI